MLTRRSRNLFLAAVGAIALHVVDDNFIQPQPGTSAGDHLFSGLIPLAVLGLAAWAYLRVGPGARATIALSLCCRGSERGRGDLLLGQDRARGR